MNFQILIVSSSVAVTLCLSGMGVLTQTNILPAWVTAVFMLLYCLTFMFGAGSVPYILVTECFIPEVCKTFLVYYIDDLSLTPSDLSTFKNMSYSLKFVHVRVRSCTCLLQVCTFIFKN